MLHIRDQYGIIKKIICKIFQMDSTFQFIFKNVLNNFIFYSWVFIVIFSLFFSYQNILITISFFFFLLIWKFWMFVYVIYFEFDRFENHHKGFFNKKFGWNFSKKLFLFHFLFFWWKIIKSSSFFFLIFFILSNKNNKTKKNIGIHDFFLFLRFPFFRKVRHKKFRFINFTHYFLFIFGWSHELHTKKFIH